MLFLATVTQAQECNIIYVTPSGASAGIAGTKANPASLTYALTLVSANDNRIWLAEGSYPLANTLSIPSNVTIDGGFNAATWIKSNATATIINRSAANPDNANLALVAFQALNQTGFSLHDLTINVVNAPSASMSVYGLRLSGCSNYNIVRCAINTGNGGAGVAGTIGANGTNATAGANGQAGDDDLRNNSGRGGAGGAGAGGTTGGAGAVLGGGGGLPGLPGGAGGATAANRNGGGGGGGGCGAHDDLPGGIGGQGSSSFGNNTLVGAGGPGGGGCCDQNNAGCINPRLNGTNGSDGVNGANGAVGAAGTAAHAAGFYVPANGLSGIDGFGGQGGAGGGGGSGDRGLPVLACTFSGCTSGTGCGGGGGGGGGQGGAGGTGGTGGGGSFPIYLFNNGTNGNITDALLTPGTGGAGGIGGTGGTGGPGAAGGARGTANAEVGCGGDGGRGGNGGIGGQGGNGSNGETIAIYQNGAAPIVQGNTVPGNPPIISVLNSGCVNQTILFQAPVSGTWNFGAGASPQTANSAGPVQVTYSTLGRKDITYNGTVFTEFIDIFNSSAPAGNIITPPAQLVAGCPVSFSSTLAGTFYEWLFTSPAIPDSAAGASLQTIDSVYFINPGQYTVTLRVATPTSCCGVLADTLVVNVVPNNINVSISYLPDTLCAGSSATFTASPSGYQQYSFFVNNVVQQQTASNTFVFAPQAGDSITVAAFDGACFTNPSASAVVPIYNLPTPTIISSDADNIICTGENITFTASPSSFDEYRFLLNGVQVQSTSSNTYNTSNLTDGSVVSVIGLNNGCPSDTSTLITTQVIQVNRPNAGTDFAICIDAPAENLAGNPTGGTWSGTGVSNANANFDAAVSGIGSFDVVYTVFDTVAGCNAFDTLVATVNDLPIVSAGNDTIACSGVATQLNASGAVSYVWSPSTGLDNANISNPFATLTADTVYTVTGTDANNCVNSDSIAISIIEIPVADFSALSDCAGKPISFTNNSTPANLNYSWNFGNGNNSAQENPIEIFQQGGSYTVSLVVDNGNCSDTSEQTLLVFNQPQADFTASPLRVVQNEEAVVFENNSINGTIWSWNFGDSTTATEFEPTHIYSDSGLYTIILIAANTEGCFDTLVKNNYVEVYEKPVFYIPNAFSPNGDGENETFQIYGSGFNQFYLNIHNRWGQKVFETNDVNFIWDGTFKGKAQEQGVYVYYVKAEFTDFTIKTFKGSLTLLR